MKKILITGINGFLGSYLAKTYDKSKYTVWGTAYNQSIDLANEVATKNLNVSNREEVNKVLNDFFPDIIIHTAGVSNVDLAEKNPSLCYDSVVIGTWNIAQWCNLHKKQLIYCSTNAIFSGNEAPYREISLPCPINVYGMYKYMAESVVSHVKSHLIFRLILMYGWNHHSRINPVTFVINSLKNEKSISMVRGASYVNPIYVKSCCEGIWKGITLEKDKNIYHLAGKDTCDRYQLALRVAEVFNLNSNLIIPVPENYFASLAKRPFDTSYITKKAEQELGFKPLSLMEGLRLMKEEGETKG